MFPEAAAALDRRLDQASKSPIAVAVSGGADSLCTLLAVATWAKAAGRPVVALSVDHRLQSGSDRWTAFALERAARLGADVRPLRWEGEKPLSGIPAAARAARHRLLADAARDAGALVIVTGHTADDARENAALGQGPLDEWSPSPVWPHGRDLFLLRPLLGLGRAVIRQRLSEIGETWIDDPANEDASHPRIRVRQSGAGAPPPRPRPALAPLARQVDSLWGGFRLDRQALRDAEPDVARRVIAAAVTCAGGGQAPPRGARLSLLMQRLLAPQPCVSTLAGARIAADGAVVIARNAGERARGGLAPQPLGRALIWDGRYEFGEGGQGMTVWALAGHARSLPAPERAALTLVPAAFRASLPLIDGPDGATCPVLATRPPPVGFRALTALRFAATCGAITQECEAQTARHGATAPSALCNKAC